MRKLSLFLMTVLIASSAIAQNENEKFEQRVYFVRAIPAEPQENRAALVAECESAIAAFEIAGIDMQGPNARAVRASLHRVLNQDKSGRVKEDKSNPKQRGEMLVCQDFDSFFLSGQANFLPSFYVVSIDGLTFAAEGGGISNSFGQLPGGGQFMTPFGLDEIFYPAQDVFLVNGSATIFASTPYDLAISLGIPEDIAASGGTMTCNSLADNADPNGEDDQFETESYCVIRLLISIQD